MCGPFGKKASTENDDLWTKSNMSPQLNGYDFKFNYFFPYDLWAFKF